MPIQPDQITGQQFNISIGDPNEPDNLKRHILFVTRSGLDGQALPFPKLNLILKNFNFVRINRLSKFWATGENEDQSTLLEQSTEDLMSSLYGQLKSWIFLVKGTPTEIECRFGMRETQFQDIVSTLTGIFPDLRYGDTYLDETWMSSLNRGLALTGVPCLTTDPEKETNKVDRIDRLCRGLFNSNWSYIVYASPINRKEANVTANEISDQIKRIYDRFFVKGSNTTEPDPLAKRYVELLQAKQKRFQQAYAAGLWATQVWLLTDDEASLGRGRGLLHSAFGGESLTEPLRTLLCDRNAKPNIPLEPLNSKELAILTCFPREEHPGYEITDYTRFGTNFARVQAPKKIRIGSVIDRGNFTGNELTISLDDLTKHGLICGVTGSGKTNTCFNLLQQIWVENGIPFTVIESAKSEYRRLLRNNNFNQKLRVFTIGDETTSPLRLNPFEVQKGILIQTHIDYLKSLFSAAFVLYPPMPYILDIAIQEIYQDRGWDLVANTNYRGEDNERAYPVLGDLIEKVKVISDRMGYAGEISSNIKAGLVARLEQLASGGGKGPMLNTRTSIPLKEIFESPCIIELKQVVSDDEKAFFIGLIIMKLYEYCEAKVDVKTASANCLQHITLIEEAHRLLRNVSTHQDSEVSANPQGRAVEVFGNILAEIRAYGEGILIAEQLPVKLIPDALKNTNLKIVHRLVSKDDREAVGNTINLDDNQTRYLTTLETGEAVAYTEGMQKPTLLKIPRNEQKSDNQEVSTSEVKSAMMASFWSNSNSQNLKLPLSGCINCPSQEIAGKSCANKEANNVDSYLLNAFRRLFNALRLNPPNGQLLLEAYKEFHLLCQQYQARHRVSTKSYCIFVELINREVEARGVFAKWKYRDVQEVINTSCYIVNQIYTRLKSDGDRLAEQLSGYKTLSQLAKLLTDLHQTDDNSLPYAGCVLCKNPCHYRFDMNFPLNHSYSKDFFSSMKAKDEAELSKNLLDVTNQFWLTTDMQQAALCFAVRQFELLNFTREQQIILSKNLMIKINNIEILNDS